MPRDSKPEIAIPRKVVFATSDSEDAATGWIVRMSVAGAQIESLQAPPTGSEVLLCADLLDGEEPVGLRGRVQWSTPTQFAIQFGALGARETNAIVRASGRRTAA